MQMTANELPFEPLKLGSVFYIERPPIEETIYEEVTKPGSIIRIKSPQKMGKTSLVLRLIKHTNKIGYRTVYLDLMLAEQAVFTSLDTFLRWFCTYVSKQLDIEPDVNNYWDHEIGSIINCNQYFQRYLLPKVNAPVVLIVNELNQVFEYPSIAKDFLGLLRCWYEEAKYNDLLRPLRLVLVYSTEVYIRLNINKSPFNVGLPVELPEFTIEQIQELALRHGLYWHDKSGRRNAFELKSLVGGHPYLVRIFLYNYAINTSKNFDEILAESHTLTGVYGDYLKNLLAKVIEHPELVTALKDLINLGGKVEFDPIIAYKLESLGLVKLEGNECTFYCELYRKYFTAQNLEQLNIWQFMKKLQRQNELLEFLSYQDELTLLHNQRYFDANLQKLWLMLAEEEEVLSVILLDIDYLKTYNQHCGRKAGDDCIRRVADVVAEIVSINSYQGNYQLKASRYGGGEFAILVPGRTANETLQIAELIRQQVKELKIQHTQQVFGFVSAYVTVSLGIASAVPCPEESHFLLLEAARNALDKSKLHGRDCISADELT